MAPNISENLVPVIGEDYRTVLPAFEPLAKDRRTDSVNSRFDYE